MQWNLTLNEKYDHCIEFTLKSRNSKKHIIVAKTPEELRRRIKEITMDEIKFHDQIYSSPLDLNLGDVFPISYLEIKDIYKKLDTYSGYFQISENSLLCSCCGKGFTDYRSCVHHINRKGIVTK